MLEGIIHHSTLKNFSATDGTKIFYREWKGSTKKPVLIYLHGLQSHMGWFTEIGNLLSKKGFPIYLLERRGSGVSQTDRGHMESFWVLIKDVKEAIELVKRKHPGQDVYLMGSCWGGKIAVTFAACHQDLIDGLVLITPAIKTHVDLSVAQKFDIAMSNMLNPRKLINVPLHNGMFTKNKKYIEFIENDSLKLEKVTARFFFETGIMNFRFNAIAHKIHVPVLVLLAGDDVIVNNDGIKKWFKRLGSTKKSIKLFEGCYHGLQFEKTKEIIDYITSWIEKGESVERQG